MEYPCIPQELEKCPCLPSSHMIQHGLQEHNLLLAKLIAQAGIKLPLRH
jgi:hypothetical protein